MSVFKYHAFIYFLRPPPWYGTLLAVTGSVHLGLRLLVIWPPLPQPFPIPSPLKIPSTQVNYASHYDDFKNPDSLVRNSYLNSKISQKDNLTNPELVFLRLWSCLGFKTIQIFKFISNVIWSIHAKDVTGAAVRSKDLKRYCTLELHWVY